MHGECQPGADQSEKGGQARRVAEPDGEQADDDEQRGSDLNRLARPEFQAFAGPVSNQEACRATEAPAQKPNGRDKDDGDYQFARVLRVDPDQTHAEDIETVGRCCESERGRLVYWIRRGLTCFLSG